MVPLRTDMVDGMSVGIVQRISWRFLSNTIVPVERDRLGIEPMSDDMETLFATVCTWVVASIPCLLYTSDAADE